MSSPSSKFNVVDLFSGAGGMSYGFHRHPSFQLIAAADAEFGKPSSGHGKLQCNSTYSSNMGIVPCNIDLSKVAAGELRSALGLGQEVKIDVLSACPPCTGFSRANPTNHLKDDMRNSLVRKSAKFAVALDADIVVMENARELMRGNFKHHYEWFREYLEDHGYDVFGKIYFLNRFGLPQVRERAIVIAAKHTLPLHNLDSLWDGWTIDDEALTVRRAFASVDPKSTAFDVYPKFASEEVRRRIHAIPKDGGSWIDLVNLRDADKLLTPSMKRTIAADKIGSYPDVYGRLAWDKPSPTIKRECAHIGNGRYAHPEEDRLCTVREMAMLQGFPNDFVLRGTAISNLYRHLGDAVPPLISYQIAHLCNWMLTDVQPELKDVLLKGTHLRKKDIIRKSTEP
jgi:DNA (cytosine-5)-methyltransferase 1